MESQNTEMKGSRETGRDGRDGGIEDIERKKGKKEKGGERQKGNTLVSKLTFNTKTTKRWRSVLI